MNEFSNYFGEVHENFKKSSIILNKNNFKILMIIYTFDKFVIKYYIKEQKDSLKME